MADMYQLTITKFKENPDFAAEYVAWKQRSENRFGMDNGEPPKVIQDRELYVTLTAEEYAAVKRAVLETFL